jgi:response regulator RpfG family c-di-GMP phosphodiesterase
MYLQDKYNITTTTDLEIVKCVSDNSEVDLVLMDTEPSPSIENLCEKIRNKNSKLPIILTYVYKKQFSEYDKKIRKKVNSVFYKPYDLNEIAVKVSSLIV